MEIALHIQHISKSYPGADIKALDDVSLVVEKGTIVGILGPNGAGKTTLIAIISGLLKADQGTVRLNGLSQKDKKFRYLLGVVPQEYALYFELTPVENLLYFGRMLDIPEKNLRAKIDEILTVLGLFEVRNKKLKTFSGGMKRRINLAASILHNPEILILDEPTVGVDVQSRAAIVSYLKALNKTSGMTIIYTSHLMAEAHELCQQVHIIEEGKILESGSPDELIRKTNSATLEEVFLQLTGKTIRN
jgi:ABC-2 type transport system ATP-binding protein